MGSTSRLSASYRGHPHLSLAPPFSSMREEAGGCRVGWEAASTDAMTGKVPETHRRMVVAMTNAPGRGATAPCGNDSRVS